MGTRVRGDERLGQDDDEGKGGDVRVVQIENAYFEKLNARLKTGVSQDSGPLEPGGTGPHIEPEKPGPVIYNDDGSIYKKPG